MSEPKIYRIIRFHRDANSRTVKNNVTLSEAREHCSDEATHGMGWFDGYDYMPGCQPDEDPE
jgi:hypothetical protein